MADVEKTAIIRVKYVVDQGSLSAMKSQMASIGGTVTGGGVATGGGKTGVMPVGGGGVASSQSMIGRFVIGGALGGTLGALGAAFGTGPMLAGVAIHQTVGLIKAGTEAYADLEDAMYRVQYNANLTKQEMDDLSMSIDGMTASQSMQAKAMEYGVSTAVENAEAMAFLTTSGYDYSESLNIMDAAMVGALATGQDMSTIIDGLIPTLQAFDIETENTAETVALLANAARIGSVDIQDLSANMGTVAALMGQANSGLAETLGILEQISVSGITDPAQVFTGLRNMAKEFTDTNFLEKLESSFKNVNEMSGTKFSIFEDGTENLKSVLQILTDIGSAMDVSDSNIGFVMNELFPDIRGRQAAAAFFGDEPLRAIEETYLKIGEMYGLTQKDMESLGYTANAVTDEQIQGNIDQLAVLNDIEEAERLINEDRIKNGQEAIDIQQELTDAMYENAETASEKVSISLNRIKEAFAAILTGGGEGTRDLLYEIANALDDPGTVEEMSNSIASLVGSILGLASAVNGPDGTGILSFFKLLSGSLQTIAASITTLSSLVGFTKNFTIDMAGVGITSLFSQDKATELFYKNLQEGQDWSDAFWGSFAPGAVGMSNISSAVFGTEELVEGDNGLLHTKSEIKAAELAAELAQYGASYDDPSLWYSAANDGVKDALSETNNIINLNVSFDKEGLASFEGDGSINGVPASFEVNSGGLPGSNK